MHLKSSLHAIQTSLDLIGERLVLAKEPSEYDQDVDVFITNRVSRSTKHLQKTKPLPLIYKGPTSGFGYFISANNRIQAIDLFDTPSLNDYSIDWFYKRALKSQFDPRIKVLCPEDQAAKIIYKSLTKPKYKPHRFQELLEIRLTTSTEKIFDAVSSLCKTQGKDYNFKCQATYLVKQFDQGKPDEDSFRRIVQSAQQIPKDGLPRKLRHIRNRFLQTPFISKPTCALPVVCCVGVDGSGKSTITAGVKNSVHKLDSKTYRLELKTAYKPHLKVFVSAIQKINRHIQSLRMPKTFHAMQRKLVSLEEYSALYVTYIDTKLKIRAMQKATRNGNLVVVDRWWVDFFVAEKNKPLIEKYPSLLERYLSLPHPDIFFLLEVPIMTSMSRRENEDLNRISYKKIHLKSFMQKHFPNSTIFINGEVEAQENLSFIMEMVYLAWQAKQVQRW